MRSVAALLIAAAALFAIHRTVVVPWRCNEIEGVVDRATPDAAPTEDPTARARAERNLALLRRCLDECRTDVNLPMLAGANLVTLGRFEVAEGLYRRALQYEERPELYLALGMTQADLGRPEEALANVVRAVDFTGDLTMLDELSDPLVKWRATEIVGKRRERYLAASGDARTAPHMVDNRRFDMAGPNGMTSSSAAEGISASAAARWEIVNAPGATTTTTLVPSTRRPGGRAMLVRTNSASSGIRQVWPGGAVPRVRTRVVVMVKRGRVAAGSGRLAPMNDAYTKTHGQWEEIEGLNQSCPGLMTQITAVSDGGAEFLIDSVGVQYTISAPPCHAQ